MVGCSGGFGDDRFGGGFCGGWFGGGGGGLVAGLVSLMKMKGIDDEDLGLL